MKKWLTGLLVLVLVLSTFTAAYAKNDKEKKNEKFRLGVEVLLKDQIDLIKGKRVGLITNPTGVDQNLNSIVDALYNNPDVELTALYGPEHGVRGDAQAGAYVEKYTDEKTGLPVYSLYGQTKKPTPEMLSNVDVLLFDIQDVGARFYTYIYTMALAMEAAKENNIPIIVLDRPNPISGTKVEGPVLEDKYSSFVGEYPIPVRHGMTVGELAKLFNKEFEIGADLTVVEMEGWKRNMYYDETPLHFVLPSPNMPTLDTTLVYTGAALIEGTNVSEGRGTTKPFELIGAPFINSADLAAQLNSYKLPGVTFRAASFTPTFSKHVNKLSHGVQIHVTNRNAFKPFETGLYIVKTIHDMYPNDFAFRTPGTNGISFFDNLVGNGSIRTDIEAGKSVEEMKAKWQSGLDEFMTVREQYLLY
ncbi:exo-beta-N-acetylmuramidase NamZ family protein [Bacillus sp. JJ1562]|uniref:exo-beta-N-acetylmuramidase NamZ family protein n=1 Tax=Bacillus sp. JJ1562 TaxID=3122960 RepID=UPI0030011F32